MNFLLTAHYSLLALRNPRQHLSTMLGTILRSKISKKKKKNHHKNMENMVLNKLWKGCLFSAWNRRNESRVSPCSTSAGNVQLMRLKVFTCLQVSPKAPQVLIWGLQINLSKQVGLQIWALRILWIDCMCTWRLQTLSLHPWMQLCRVRVFYNETPRPLCASGKPTVIQSHHLIFRLLQLPSRILRTVFGGPESNHGLPPPYI